MNFSLRIRTLFMIALALGSIAPPATADPTSCACNGETFRAGTVLKNEYDNYGRVHGYRTQIVEFLDPVPSGRCLAKVMFLGHYQADFRGSKAKYLPEGTALPDVKGRFAHYGKDPEITTLVTCQKDRSYVVDVTFESIRLADQQPALAAPQAVVGARPRPADAVAADAASAPVAPKPAPVTAIAVDPETGEPLADATESLNAELELQLEQQGWTPGRFAESFYRTGRIVAARKPLKLPVAKGKGTVSLEEGQLGQVVSTGSFGAQAGASPKVYVLWQKKRSNLIPILKTILLGASLFSGGPSAYVVSQLLGGWQSFGEIKYVLAPADAADLIVIK